MTERGTRLAEIDAMKVAGAVTIVLIHVMRPPWDPALSPIEQWLGHATRFAVPAFLFASGFLYATATPNPIATVGKRLRRILIPYLIASLLAHALGASDHASRDPAVIAGDLLWGSAFGPFYYVFVITGLVLVSPLFERMSARGLAILTLGCFAMQGVLELSSALYMPLHLHIRNPGLWWSYYLAGWWLRLHGEAFRRVATARRAPLSLVGVGLVAVLLTLAGGDESAHRVVVRAGAWLGVWAILATIWVSCVDRVAMPTWLTRLSEATYAIFLYHLFFVRPASAAFPLPDQSLSLVGLCLPWVLGVVVPIGLVIIARASIGERSRLVFGA